jgi:hypothetical protein
LVPIDDLVDGVTVCRSLSSVSKDSSMNLDLAQVPFAHQAWPALVLPNPRGALSELVKI